MASLATYFVAASKTTLRNLHTASNKELRSIATYPFLARCGSASQLDMHWVRRSGWYARTDIRKASQSFPAVQSFSPKGEVIRVSIPDRMKLISWFSSHNALDQSALEARCIDLPLASSTEARSLEYSWCELKLCFSKKEATRLRELFRQAKDSDAIRFGRLLEVLDCFAGDVAFSFCRPAVELNERKSDLFVTVSIDSIRFFGTEDGAAASNESETPPRISVLEDLTLRGFVSYVGRSSVEISAELHQNNKIVGSAFLVFVHVGKDGKPKYALPLLKNTDESPEANAALLQAATRHKFRKENASKALEVHPPDQNEAKFLHETWIKTNDYKRMRWIEDTRLDTCILMQPETISMYGRAFGGYIMRSAMELSWLVAQRFLQTDHPILTGMDDIVFYGAVRMGDMLRLSCHVVWSDDDEIQLQVEAFSDSVGSPRIRTNRLIFYYKQMHHGENQEDTRVYPRSYGEFIYYLEGRRRSIYRQVKRHNTRQP